MQIGLAGVLFVVFLVLKLLDKITWSWWWVTAPLWGGVAFWVVAMVLIGIVAVIVEAKPKKAKNALREELNRRHARARAGR